MITAATVALYVLGVFWVIKLGFEFFGWDEMKVNDYYLFRTFGDRPLWQKALMKPLFYCGPCMCSLHGTFCYWLLLGGRDIGEWIYSCVAAVFIVIVVNMVIDRIDR
jgi:hypothetical protein